MKDTRRNSQNQLILAHRGSQTLNDLCMCLAAVLVLLVRLLKGIAETDSVFFFHSVFFKWLLGPYPSYWVPLHSFVHGEVLELL